MNENKRHARSTAPTSAPQAAARGNSEEQRKQAKRTGDVLSPVLNGALAGDNGLHEEAEHGEHREAAVLDLLHLELRERVGVVREAQGVEALTCGAKQT